ncbi:Hsp20 family protein [Sphingosinicella terrae]|uniref:Hsp20 family protein n=1 Tax=Sphingosinicella terrae TaxID=2172047 RepID=UPI000E0DA640|nr:Hsp20 family protein [Sphingosinicella terrae]
MRTSIDLTPFRHATVGFDRLFDLLEAGLPSQVADNYPPFDLVQEGEDRYRITLAVAGFRPDEIEVTTQQNLLIVSGRRGEDGQARYIHRGIAARAFERRFALADHVQVRSADLRDGILSIDLEREIPEAMKPRRIEISGSDTAPRLDAAGTAEAGNENVKALEAV